MNKTCSICKQEKPISNFGPKGKLKNGDTRYESRCKPCKNEQNRNKYHTNADKINERRKELRDQDRERYNSKKRESYWRHRDAIVERRREQYNNSPEQKKKQAERVNKYREDNPEWHKEYKKEYQKEWRKNNPEKIYAHSLMQRLRKNGVVKKPKYCQLCNKEAFLEGHHSDYSKPDEVIWLCRLCHSKITLLARK